MLVGAALAVLGVVALSAMLVGRPLIEIERILAVLMSVGAIAASGFVFGMRRGDRYKGERHT